MVPAGRSVEVEIPARSGGFTQITLAGPHPAHVRNEVRRHGLFSYGGRTAATLLALAENDPAGCFLDVGANIGLYSLILAKTLPDLAVHAFEPTPSSCENLRAGILINGVDVRLWEAAVSDRPGTVSLQISNRTDVSNSVVVGHRPSSEQVDVPSITLDGILADLGAAPTLIKIDVERHEAAVLAGAQRLIRVHRPLIVMEMLSARDASTGHRTFRPEAAAARRILMKMGYTSQRITTPPHLREVMTNGWCDDHIMWPGDPDPRFAQRYETWLERLLEVRGRWREARACTAAARAAERARDGVGSEDGEP